MNHCRGTSMTELVGPHSVPSLPPILVGHVTPEIQERVEQFYFSVAVIFNSCVKRRQSRHTRAYREVQELLGHKHVLTTQIQNERRRGTSNSASHLLVI